MVHPHGCCSSVPNTQISTKSWLRKRSNLSRTSCGLSPFQATPPGPPISYCCSNLHRPTVPSVMSRSLHDLFSKWFGVNTSQGKLSGQRSSTTYFWAIHSHPSPPDGFSNSECINYSDRDKSSRFSPSPASAPEQPSPTVITMPRSTALQSPKSICHNQTNIHSTKEPPLRLDGTIAQKAPTSRPSTLYSSLNTLMGTLSYSCSRSHETRKNTM